MISNASPIIILTKIDLIEETLKFYGQIEISQHVYQEAILNGIKIRKQDAIILNALLKAGKIKIIELNKNNKKISEKIINNYSLDKGEAETIALAIQLNKKEVLMDEFIGRKITKLFNIKPKGTLRVLLELYNKNYIEEKKLKEKVEEIIGKQFRLDAEVMNKFWELFRNMKEKNKTL